MTARASAAKCSACPSPHSICHPASPSGAGPSWSPSARTGTALFLDVDVVITGSLDDFFTQPGEFLIIHDYKRPWRITGNSSVYRFELGAHPDVLEHFRAHFSEIREQFRNEQAYLSDFLHRQGKLQYWPAAWGLNV